MEIIVCIKQVPGTTEVEIDEETGVLKRDGIEAKMNPYDLYAIEIAVRIKEDKGAKVTAITMGPQQAIVVLREAFMMGADETVLLTDRRFAGADVLATSYALAQGIKRLPNNVDLIICGKMTTDGDTAQVGPEIAEFIGVPHISNVLNILEIKERSIVVEMDMGHTIEIAEVNFPCLITVEKGINQPRLPSFKRRLETESKEISVLSLNDFEDQDEKRYGLNGSPTQVKRIFPPETNTNRELWKGSSQELSDRLVNKLMEMKFVQEESGWQR
ncbi:electron transfer flavoprotein subunit beta/FixA family protein [Sinanaerobacter chloroacetimidivorans]|uniref:Electron transfer flavoprotein small subunit n=1 Tax=Sinanaerobacter chloroacetimidivorans TaxID=2818044 RepID=A0A8J7W4B0_9FIRM|nr:electron transfer flavoprotein subunit beta/FixA family protein [Sinanaerobacter chloroacetimidivorans]MBR0600096.1 electron transfer flavoprotein subunit beta/FixA family protein [Sinanaerobacter chloroacetimidivorans]